MASMVTSAPSSCLASAKWSRSCGMAVISLFFSGTLSCPQDEPGIGRIGAQGTERLESLALVVGAARRLAVDGDQIMPARPEFLDPALETAPEQQRVETVEQRPQPAGTRDPKMKWREPS